MGWRVTQIAIFFKQHFHIDKNVFCRVLRAYDVCQLVLYTHAKPHPPSPNTFKVIVKIELSIKQ